MTQINNEISQRNPRIQSIYYQFTSSIEPMFRFYKSKHYLKAYNILQTNSFFSQDFSNYRINAIVRTFINHHQLFDSLMQILNEVKLTPLQILKIQLLVQCLLQMDCKMQQNEQIFDLLHKLREKIRQITVNICSLQNSSIGSRQSIISSKDSWNESEYIFQDGVSLLTARIIDPLLQLQERLIFSYDLTYRPANTDELQLNQCWAALNLLKKFVQISPQVEAIGRYYYKQYCGPIFSLIKVLDVDIQMLYKRIKGYIFHKIREYEVLLQNQQCQQISADHHQRMKEFLQLIDELEIVNQYIRLLYLNKYFLAKLMSNQVFQPSLYKPESNLALIYQIKSQISPKYSPSRKSPHKNINMISDQSQNVQEV